MEPKSYQCSQELTTGPYPDSILGSCLTFCNKLVFYDEELSTPHTTLQLEFHPILAVCDCLFNIYPATLHIWRMYTQSSTQGCAMVTDPCNVALI